MSEARSQSAPWEENAHARTRFWCEATAKRVRDCDPPKRPECRETLGSPIPEKSHGAQDSVRHPRGESRGANRERARYGYTSIAQVANVGRTHLASCLSRSRKTSGRTCKALAGRKLLRTLTRRGSGEKAKRCAESASTVKGSRSFWLVSFRSRVLDTTAGILGLSPLCPSLGSRNRSPQTRGSIPQRKAHRATQRSVGRALE